MREEGLEPSHPCGHRHLKPARLPIPPLALTGTAKVSRTLCFLRTARAGPVDRSGDPLRPRSRPYTRGSMGFKTNSGFLVDRFSRVFRTGIRSTTLGRRVGRLFEKERTTDIRGHTVVPNYLIVALSEKDRKRFTQVEEPLRRQLADIAHEYARSKAYGFSGPLSIDFATNPRFRKGRFEVSGQFREAPIGDAAVLVTSDGRRVEITTPQILGRNDDCGVVLAGSNVSRHHAEIRADQHGLFIVDLGSTNGTLVDGVAVGTHRLLHGDIITIGDHHLRVEVV